MQTPQRRSHMPSNAYCCAGEQPPLWWGWCKLLLWSCQSLSKCDSAGEMAENVSGLWTPPGALSNLFWWSGAVMAICRSPPSCTQPAARQAVVTTSLQCCFQQSAQTKKGLAVFTQSSEDKRYVDQPRFRNRVIFRNVLNNWFTKQGLAEAVSERVMVKRSDQHLLQKYHSHASFSHSCASDHLGWECEGIRFIDQERRVGINTIPSYSHRNSVAYYRSTAQIAYFITLCLHILHNCN